MGKSFTISKKQKHLLAAYLKFWIIWEQTSGKIERAGSLLTDTERIDISRTNSLLFSLELPKK